ncbi:MAG TPA: hypothetical protein VE631_03090 [Alphaproteobacteria bacterium]|nr:hypothetical protein [Alphaproteobacteria bacterium]
MRARPKQVSMPFVVFACLLALWTTSFLHPAHAADEKWKSEAIADALLAAPPSVTDNATIFGWTADGDLVLARFGTGPYTCVSSGAFSLRVGKPPLPYPDPMCMDQNAWAFLQAVWSEKDPLHPEKPFPTAPGLVWMLAGMSVNKGAVAVGSSETSVVKTAAAGAGGDMFQMTPHVMIMPVPFNKEVAEMGTSYNLDHPLSPWIMAAGTPYEHLMVHFSGDDVTAMMQAGK